MTDTEKQDLLKALNALAPGSAKLFGPAQGIKCTLRNPRTGNSASWMSIYHTGETPTAEQVIADLRKQLGIAVKRTSAIKRSQEGAS